MHAEIHTPPGVDLETPLGVGLETSIGVGLDTLLARPLNLPYGCGPGDLQGIMGYHLPPWTEFLTHPSENITLPQLR